MPLPAPRATRTSDLLAKTNAAKRSTLVERAEAREALTQAWPATDSESDVDYQDELDKPWAQATRPFPGSNARGPTEAAAVTQTGLLASTMEPAGAAGRVIPAAVRQPASYTRWYPKHRAFITNLPREGVTAAHLVKLFDDRGDLPITEADVDLPWDPVTKRLRGFAYCTFGSEYELMRALKLTGVTLLGSALVITVASDPNHDTAVPIAALEGRAF